MDSVVVKETLIEQINNLSSLSSIIETILVDDSIGCITPFASKGGHAIHHSKSSDTIQQIHDTIRGIRGLYALRKDYA